MPQMLAYSKAHWSSRVRGPAGMIRREGGNKSRHDDVRNMLVRERDDILGYFYFTR